MSLSIESASITSSPLKSFQSIPSPCSVLPISRAELQMYLRAPSTFAVSHDSSIAEFLRDADLDIKAIKDILERHESLLSILESREGRVLPPSIPSSVAASPSELSKDLESAVAYPATSSPLAESPPPTPLSTSPNDLIKGPIGSVNPEFPDTETSPTRGHENAHLSPEEHDEIIEQLESHILDFKTQQAAYEADRAAVSSLIFAPIRRLPPELLQEIFLFSVYSDFSNTSIGLYGCWKSVAFEISAVCGWWRDLALDTKEMWAQIAASCCSRAAQPVRLCLERSGSVPLVLQIATQGLELVDLDTMKLLVAESKRWLVVDYHHLYNEEAREVLRNEVSRRLPALKSVVPAIDPDTRCVLLEAQLRDAPSLETVTVRRLKRDKGIAPRSLPLERTKHLVMQASRGSGLQSFLDILSICAKNLQTITYEDAASLEGIHHIFKSSHTPLSIPFPPPIVSSATELLVSSWQAHGIYELLSDLFQSVTLPSLTELRIGGDCDNNEQFEGNWPGDVMRSFLNRSKCQLTLVSLHGMPLSEQEVVEFLKLTPLVQTLNISELFAPEYLSPQPNMERWFVKTVTKDLLTQLTIGGDEPFLPRLEWLGLRVQNHFDADLEFIGMVKSRWYNPRAKPASWPGRVSRLLGVSLTVLGGQLDKSVYGPLVEAEMDGLRVTVLQGDGDYVL
ncbi:hypothetical protein V5O48_009428 [Marasmius crinis-equi]|uniref:F-box domain-containing protein n=1 Tax=Marasmius crinis-equi TaxID=585013 RepID=A0ABR3FBU9_9AGAR